MKTEKITYPVRINRYLLLKGFCSRREADRLISQGRIKINKKTAVIGQKVEKGDKVEVDKHVKKLSKERVYLAYYKPKGVVSHNPQKGQKGIDDVIKYKGRVFPMGRLDKESHGLMILSNDGRITNKLLNPKYKHDKEYIVKVNKFFGKDFMDNMESGVNIEGYRTKKAKIKKLSSRDFKLTLTEGKKHQIRRMCAALGYEVKDLQRTRVLNITLRNLKSNQYREIEGKELEKFLETLKV